MRSLKTLKMLAAAALLSVVGIGCGNESSSEESGYSSASTSRSTAATRSSERRAGTGDAPKSSEPLSEKAVVAKNDNKAEAKKSPASAEKPAKSESTSAAPKSGSAKLHGKWAGVTKVDLYGIPMKITAEFEFKPNGCVEWYEKIEVVNTANPDVPGFATEVQGSGTYTVTRTDGDRFTLKLSNDLDPDRTFGWIVNFKGNDQITITGFDDVPVTVKRQK